MVRLRNRRGVSYSLPLVFVVPLGVGFVLAAFEVGHISLARLGTRYAADAAARAAAVGADPERPAADALAPFVGRSPAAGRPRVEVTPIGADGPHQPLRVTVAYTVRLRTPVVSRLFGGRLTLVGSVTLPAERPETPTHTLGVGRTPGGRP